MTKTNYITFIGAVKSFLTKKGASDLEADKVASVTRKSKSNDDYSCVKGISRPSATITLAPPFLGAGYNYVSAFSCTLHLVFPDAQGSPTASIRVRYTCDCLGNYKAELDYGTFDWDLRHDDYVEAHGWEASLKRSALVTQHLRD